jgi:hypothetical protein
LLQIKQIFLLASLKPVNPDPSSSGTDPDPYQSVTDPEH